MPKEKPKYPFIKLSGRNEEFELGYSAFGNPLPEGGINVSQFKNKLNEVLSVGEINSKFLDKYFFEIDLRIDYYLNAPQDLFKQLGVEVRSVFSSKEGSRKVIVSGSKDTIKKYKDKSSINKEFLKCISDIKRIDSNSKIGDSIKENWDDKRAIKVNISFISSLSDEEIKEINKIDSDLFNDIKLGKYTATASGMLTKSRIQQIAKIPLVKRIAQPSKWKASFIAKASGLSSDFKIINKSGKLLPTVCVIDTGIANGLKDVSEQFSNNGISPFDNNGHGTAVSSLCMFNRYELMTSNTIEPTINVISHKISEQDTSDDLNFVEELIKIIELHKYKTKVFCLSWNCISYDEIQYEDSIKELDEYLQINDLLLINSAGNLDRDEAASMFQRYPSYLLENPVMTPSEAKYVFSVGSSHQISPYTTILSPFTRTFLPLNAINKPEDIYIRIKPEVYAEGGFIKYAHKKEDDIYKGIVCLDNKCTKFNVAGTSLSAPQIARASALLLDNYKMKYSETIKAMIFLKSRFFKQVETSMNFKYQGKVLFDEGTILDADNGFYFFFENISQANKRFEDRKKDKVFSKSWEFPVPKEIESVEFAICHSNNNVLENLRNFTTRIVTKIFKPGTKGPISKKYREGFGTMGHKAPLIFGKYRYSNRTPEGLWKIQAYVECKGVPQEMVKKLEIRYGITIKLNIYNEFLDNKNEIYAKILRMLGKDSSQYEETIIESLSLDDAVESSVVAH